MVDAPSRRAVLRTAGVAAGTALGGCVFDNPDVSGGHLFVENMLPEDYRASITVVEGRTPGGDPVVEGWYRIPSDHAIQFGEIIHAGTAYTITAHPPNAPPEDRVTVTVPPCGGNGETARDVSVRVREDGTGIIPWDCDEEYTRREIEYVDASEYRIGTATAVTETNETGS